MSAFMWAAPLVVFTVCAIPLSVIDAHEHVLPNGLVLFGIIGVLGTELLLAQQAATWSALAQGVLIGLRTLAAYISLMIVSRGQLGMGDVKYSALTGLTVGWVAPEMWLVCIWLAFTLAALWVLILLRKRRRSRDDAIAFGPFMSLSVVMCAMTAHMIL
jgi:leader peptidase (prepilin peptidase)/N-methyltransferase